MAEETTQQKPESCCHGGCCRGKGIGGGASCGSIYGLAFIGALVYYVQQVHGFWPIVLAVLKALVWPAMLAYKVFGLLKM